MWGDIDHLTWPRPVSINLTVGCLRSMTWHGGHCHGYCRQPRSTPEQGGWWEGGWRGARALLSALCTELLWSRPLPCRAWMTLQPRSARCLLAFVPKPGEWGFVELALFTFLVVISFLFLLSHHALWLTLCAIGVCSFSELYKTFIFFPYAYLVLKSTFNIYHFTWAFCQIGKLSWYWWNLAH